MLAAWHGGGYQASGVLSTVPHVLSISAMCRTGMHVGSPPGASWAPAAPAASSSGCAGAVRIAQSLGGNVSTPAALAIH